MLERAPRFWPNRRCWSSQAVRNLSRIYYGGRIANFRPTIARSLYSAYSRNRDTVVDFSSGYGGRMLAALSLGRNYIGIDPARKQVKGLLAMRQDLAGLAPGHATVIHACAEDAMAAVPAGSADMVFSSPPFYDLEIYSDEPSQSSNRYPTYDRWRTGFLEAVIDQSWRILRRGGVFAIHVPSERKSPIGRDAFALAADRFSRVGRHAIEMTSRPLQRAGDGRSTRTEPIGVFRKT
jgi:SAM-dependent methyltransferase